MTETLRIADQIAWSHSGEAWHGPSVLEALEGVDARLAAAKPNPDLHSIWELALHITAWQRMGIQTLKGGEYISMTGEADWPPVPMSPSDDEWERTKRDMSAVNAQLVAAVRSFPQDQLEEKVPGREFVFHFLLLGIVQHNVYHAGQISLLKRLQ